MNIFVRVKPNAHKNEVVKLSEDQYVVSVTVPPVEGKANEKVVELLAKFFKKPKRAVTIVRGTTSKEKLVEIA